MPNVFTSSNEVANKPNRNTFNMGFTNNLTLKMGQITPCFIQDVISGDSVRINPSFGFNFMPMTFPVQTKIRANLHFFYVRNRALWRGWESFITKTDNEWDDKTPPYIQLTNENRDMFETGMIGDYLNVPTVFYSDGYESLSTVFRIKPSDGYIYATNLFSGANPYRSFMMNPAYHDGGFESVKTNIENFVKQLRSESDNYGVYPLPWPYANGGPYSQELSVYCKAELAPHAKYIEYQLSSLNTIFQSSNFLLLNNRVTQGLPIAGDYDEHLYMMFIDEDGTLVSAVSGVVNTGSFSDLYFYNAEMVNQVLGFNLSSANGKITGYIFSDTTISSTIDNSQSFNSSTRSYIVDGRFGIENKYRSLISLPFASTDNPDGERISSLPFRAVDACYNAFFSLCHK